MSSLIGQSLLHYRVTSAIGAGGMGEVYRATDTRLGRDVAIKVLPPDVAGDAERLSRFRREAHLLASLNHPNIAAIYGLEDAAGTPFLALELVEGDDLKDRLARGPIPVDEALEIATQIAEALEEAHNKGIVHRDLKPANVKLSSTGRVKVLDFGLAKAWSGDASGAPASAPGVSQSPTLAHTGTLAGVVLGTAAYMAPEQARGKGVDRRADIWAFGVLLWEMLTGRTMFTGETITDVIAAVVTREPDLSALPAETPAAVRRLLARCLRKDPRQRLPDIGAARLELQEVRAGGEADQEPPTRDRGGAMAAGVGRRERLAWAAVLVAMTFFAGALAFTHFREVEQPRPAVRFRVDAPAGWLFNTGFDWPVPSPDGRQIVFRATPTGRDAGPDASMLWIRDLAAISPRPLAGTEGGYLPAWSPDGTSLAFFARREVRRVKLADGSVQTVCAIPGSGGEGGLDWDVAGTILFSTGAADGRIYTVSAAGGEAKPLLIVDKARHETGHHILEVLPDGRRFLFLLSTSDDTAGVYLGRLDAPTERRRLTQWGRVAYVSGHLLFVRDGTLLAEPFDLERAAPTGEAVALASSVASWSENANLAWFAVSPGTLAYFSGARASRRAQLAWVDRKGVTLTTLGEPQEFAQISLSPDERTVALEVFDPEGHVDLWLMDVARGVMSRLTAAEGDERDPVWAPDGLSLAFATRTAKGSSLSRKGLRGSDPEIAILPPSHDETLPEQWLRDGQTLMVTHRNPDKDEQDIRTVTVNGGAVRPAIAGVRLDEPQVSPDGRWVAYVSRESGRDEVYVETFGHEGRRVQVSPAGGGQPKWRGDGREIFYVTPKNRLAAVAVRPSAESIDVSLPVELFDVSFFEGTGLDDYAVGGDGQRFLVKLPADRPGVTELHVVTNWTSLLR